MNCKLCGGEVKTENTISPRYKNVLCLNPVCKNYDKRIQRDIYEKEQAK